MAMRVGMVMVVVIVSVIVIMIVAMAVRVRMAMVMAMGAVLMTMIMVVIMPAALMGWRVWHCSGLRSWCQDELPPRSLLLFPSLHRVERRWREFLPAQ